ncbi:MAG: putative branched-chain amino acid ABC transporter, periplasmic amino acid-binding protein [Anaerolineales bacterium]|nr:putative branched-chain amino acid ABC transporter, periplasmic amino acid-binding protein [Anaerolineales bacterium]
MSKRTFSVVSLLVLASLLLAACQPATPAFTPPTDALGVVTIPSGEPIHIAYWGVLSGADATLGEDSKRGVEIAVDDKGGKLLGRDIRLTTEDGLCTPEGGATAAQKLAADTTLVGLIGSSCSDETVGGIKTLNDAGLTTISPSNTRPALTFPDRDATYAGYLRTAHSDAFQGKAVAEFVFNELKVKTAATIHDGSAYAEALQQVFADEYKKLGGTITVQEAVSKGQTDMKPVLTAVAATKPDVIYYPIFVAEGGFITAQAREVPGLENVALIGSDGMFSADMLKGAGPAAEGMYLSSPDFTAFQAGYQDFLAKHTAKYGGAPLSVFHAHAYDATNILFSALEKVAVTAPDGTIYVPKKALRDAIYATKDHKGLTGTLSCGQYGDCGAPIIAVYQVTAENVANLSLPTKPIWPTR